MHGEPERDSPVDADRNAHPAARFRRSRLPDAPALADAAPRRLGHGERLRRGASTGAMGICRSKCAVSDELPGSTFMEKRVILALQKKKAALDALSEAEKQRLTFNRIVMQFPDLYRSMSKLKLIFEKASADGTTLGLDELIAVMREMDVHLSTDECVELFQLSDVDKSGASLNRLDLQEFVVALSVAYMLEAVPSLLDAEGEFSRNASIRRSDADLSAAPTPAHSRSKNSNPLPFASSPPALGHKSTSERAQPLSLATLGGREDEDTEAPTSGGLGMMLSPTATMVVAPSASSIDRATPNTRRSLKEHWRQKTEALRQDELEAANASISGDADDASVGRGSVTLSFAKSGDVIFSGDEIRRCIHVMVAAYLLFDSECKGFVSRRDIDRVIREEGRGEGSPAFLSEQLWNNMPKTREGHVFFQDFIHAFGSWSGVEDLEDADQAAEELDSEAKEALLAPME